MLAGQLIAGGWLANDAMTNGLKANTWAYTVLLAKSVETVRSTRAPFSACKTLRAANATGSSTGTMKPSVIGVLTTAELKTSYAILGNIAKPPGNVPAEFGSIGIASVIPPANT